MRRHSRHGCSFKEIGAVLEPAVQALGASMSSSTRSTRAIPGSTSAKLYRQSRERRGCRRRVLQNEHHLKQHVPVRTARQLEAPQDFLERKVLISVGVERHLPYTPQDLAEAGVARQVGPQDDRICEHPDEALDLDLVAVGDHRPDRDIVVLRIPGQKALKCREQRHEHGDAIARLSDLTARDKVRESLNGCRAPRPVRISVRGRSVRSGSSIVPASCAHQ